PHGGAAAGSAAHGRSGHAHREPAARAAVRALPGPTGLHQPGGHPPDDRGGLLPVAAGRPLWGRAAAAAGERRVAADASRGGAAIDVAALLALLRKDTLARPVHPRDVRVRVDSGARLIGDEPEIHSAFSNLVDNAAKYTPIEGSLEMRWWVDEDGGHFAVTDT